MKLVKQLKEKKKYKRHLSNKKSYYLPYDKIPEVSKFLTKNELNNSRYINQYFRSTIKPQEVDKENYIRIDDIVGLLYYILESRFFIEFHGSTEIFINKYNEYLSSISKPIISPKDSIDWIEFKKFYDNLNKTELNKICHDIANYIQHGRVRKNVLYTFHKIFVHNCKIYFHYEDLIIMLIYDFDLFASDSSTLEYLEENGFEQDFNDDNNDQYGIFIEKNLTKKQKKTLFKIIKEEVEFNISEI